MVSLYSLLGAIITIVTILAVTQTYAWFSALLTGIDGDLSLGSLSGIVRVYEDEDDEFLNDDYIDGLTNAHVMNSTGTNLTAYNLIQREWYSNVYTSVYIEVQNTGTIDLKAIFKLNYDNSNIQTFLSYYYYQLVDITEEIEVYSGSNPREKISLYNSDFQANVDVNYLNYVDNVISNGNAVTSSLSFINMGITTVDNSRVYRLDIALSEIPTELITQFNNLSPSEKQIKVNASITLKQTNAPDDENEDSGLFTYVSTPDAFINAVNSSSNGDTIYLSANLVIGRNVTITRRVNIVLNGYTLTINGNLAYDTANTGNITLEVSSGSMLYVLNSLIIDAPNATFKLIGPGSSAQAVVLGTAINVNSGNFYVNALKDDNNPATYGFYQHGVSIVKVMPDLSLELATMRVDSNTRVSISSTSTSGSIVSVNNAQNIEVYNLGEIKNINFSTMSQVSTEKIQIYIYNRNKFSTNGPVITLPTWSLGWKSKELYDIASPVNTRVINAPGSNVDYGVSGSTVFTNIDIENGDDATEYVVFLGNNDYRVNIQLDGIGQDTYTLNYILNEYFTTNNNNATVEDYENWLLTIDSLYIYTYNTAVLKESDFTFIRNYITNLELIDLNNTKIQNNTIPNSAFANMLTLQNVVLPFTELNIGASAFINTSLDKITLTSSILSIGSNAFNISTALNGMLEVFYESENVADLLGYISGLTANKTLLFMSVQNLDIFKTNYSVTDTWYINSYANYNFVDSRLTYYRIIDGNSVEIVYYAGNWSEFILYNTVVNQTNIYNITSISSSAFRRSIAASGSASINLNFPNNITRVRSDAFYGANIQNLSLNRVTHIGRYAFAYTTILSSSARPESFTGMINVGDFAFASSKIGYITTSLSIFEANNLSGGSIKNHLDLRGSYLIGDGVFASASFYGVVLNLTNVNSLTSTMTNNLSLYGVELKLDNINLIGDSTFENKYKLYDTFYMYNKLSAKEVKTLGRLAFRGMRLDEFVIGIKTLYTTQEQVNSEVSYGGDSNGPIYSDFRVTNLIVDGMLPELVNATRGYMFGTTVANRIYDNVTIKNTNGLLYDYMFYGSQAARMITITNLNLHDITTIGSYSLYYAAVSNINFYKNDVLQTENEITTIKSYAVRYGNVASFGDLELTTINAYAFANTVVPADSITVVGNVDNNAFNFADTTNVNSISITGTIGNNAFNAAQVYETQSLYFSGTIGTNLFASAYIYDATSIIFENANINQYSFNATVIYSAANIQTLGISSTANLAFFNLNAPTSTIDLRNSITISHEALRNAVVENIYVGNTNFYLNNQSSYMYGNAQGGMFGNSTSTITNLYIEGELPILRQSVYIMGAAGASFNITNVYVSENVSSIPAYSFYSENLTNRLTISNFYISSENLIINSYAFGRSIINNFIYDAVTPGVINITGQYAFLNSVIGNFTGFTYYNSTLGKTVGVIQNIISYTFQYTTFSSDSDLSLFKYLNSIGNYAFNYATFEPTSGAQNVSLDLSGVLTIGYNIFENITTPLGSITLGNNDYYNIPGYYYGNPSGNQGIFTSSGTFTLNELIIAGNLPNPNITEAYQTRILGSNLNLSLNYGTVIVTENVTEIPRFVFAGFNQTYRTNITNLNIYSEDVNIQLKAFSYSNIVNINIYSSNININEKSFEYSNISLFTYDRTAGVGEITFQENAGYSFQYSSIGQFVGFTSGSTGVVKNIEQYAFYYATFATDANISWINYVEKINSNAFSRTTFMKTSSDEFVSLDLRNVITLGEAIFEFIPNRINSLTLGNSSYQSIYGSQYSYGFGINGVLYAAGTINTLNIVGNLPVINTSVALGNSYFDSIWAVQYGTVNVHSSVTIIPSEVFASEYQSVPVIIGTLNLNSTSLNINSNAFIYANIATVNANNNNLVIGIGAFSYAEIQALNFAGSNIELGNTAFAYSSIQNITYSGTSSGNLSMTGIKTFMSASIQNMTGFTFTNMGVTTGIISTISSYAFENATFASNANISWIQYVNTIEPYAFSGTAFNKTSSNNFIDLDLTRVLSIGSNAFYQLPIGLGTVTVGNSAYSSNPSYAYGNGIEGIFNNSGTIQHLIISGNLPATAYPFGNMTSNILYRTNYIVVDITSSVTTLPKGAFAGKDTIYSTVIGTLNIHSSNILLSDEVFNYTTINNFNVPNETSFNSIGKKAFMNALITTLNIPEILTINGTIGEYGLYGQDLTSLTLNVSGVSNIGQYAFAYTIYDKNLTFNATLSLVEAHYMFAFADFYGNFAFNSVQSLGTHMFHGITSGVGVNYVFTFNGTSLISSAHPFAYMNGGGSVNLTINNLAALNSDYAFYASSNIVNLTFDTSLISLNGNNVFENANNLISILITHEGGVVAVNATIVTIDSETKVYVPGNLLSEYLMHPYWSLIANQIRTTFNLGRGVYSGGWIPDNSVKDEGDYKWGFYIIQGTTNVSLVRYLGSFEILEVPRFISYNSVQYTVTRVEGSVFDGTITENIIFPNILLYIDIEIFSNPNIAEASYNTSYGGYRMPFLFYTESGNKVIYESTERKVLLKYFSSNTTINYTISSTVSNIGENAFRNVPSLQSISFAAGQAQTGANINSYTTDYLHNFVLGRNSIINNPALTTINITNRSSGFGVHFKSYAISSNPSLAYIYIIGYSNFINDYAIYNNTNLERLFISRVTDYAYGKTNGTIYSSTIIGTYAVFGSGKSTGTVCFYITTALNTFHSHAFSNSRFNLFELDFNPLQSEGHGIIVHNPNAFETKMEVITDGNGNVIQIFNPIEIRVQGNNRSYFVGNSGRLAYYDSVIVGVANISWSPVIIWDFTHEL